MSNVTNFGAFVDIGVHQDGLVHISCLADKFVDDPHKVVKAGQIVKVKVMEVDVKRKRIALSMRLQEDVKKQSPKKEPHHQKNQKTNKPQRKQLPKGNALADKLSAALKR